jgi:hypothetical protein
MVCKYRGLKYKVQMKIVFSIMPDKNLANLNII